MDAYAIFLGICGKLLLIPYLDQSHLVDMVRRSKCFYVTRFNLLLFVKKYKRRTNFIIIF